MVSEKDKDKKETSTKNQLEVGVLYPKNNQFYSYDGENFIQKDPEVGDKIYNFGTKTKYEYLGNDQFQELDPKLKKEEESWNQILTGKRSLAQTLVPGLGFMQSISAPVQAAITYAGKKRAGEDAGLLKPFVKGFVKGEAPEGEELTRGAIKLATGKKETAEKFYQAAEQELTKRRDATKQVYLDVFGSEKFANAMSKLQNPFGVQTIAEFATQIATDPTTWIMPGGLAKNKTLLKAAKEAALETKVADVLATQAEEPLKFVSTTAAGIQRTQPLAKTPFYSTAERPEMLDFLGDMAIDSSRIKPTPGTLEARASFIRRRPTEEAKKFPFLTQKFTEESIELPQDVSKRIVSPEFRTDTTPGAASIRERFAIGEGGQMYKETPPLIGGKERPEITAELNRRRGVISLKEKLPAGKERLLLPEHAESLIGKNLKDIGFKGTPEELAKQTKDIIAARNSVLKRVDDFKSSARVLGFDTKNIEKLSVNDFAVLESSLQKEMQNAKLGSGSIMDWAKYRPNIIAEELESYGSPLIQAGLKGSQNFNNYTGFGYRELGKFEEIMNKAFKNEGAFKSAEARIFDALENRANAFKILKSKAEVKAYEVVRKTFDAFKKLRSDRGLGVLDEYSPNINEQLDVMEGHLIDFEQSIQDFISKHSKHRVGSKGPVLKGLSSDGILSRYIASMSRELAYGDFLKLYREKGYNQLGQNYGFYVQDVVNDWIRGMVYPPRHDKMDKLASRIGAAVYDRYLSWNPGAAIQNLPQVDLAKMNITRSAKSFGNDLTGRFLGTVKEKLPANVKEYLKDIRKDVFSWTKEIAPESALKEESLLAKGIYGESEIYNWARARTWGRTQHLELSDIFKTELAKTKGDKVKALSNILDSKDPAYLKLIEDSKIRGDDLANTSQVLMGAVAEPKLFATARKSGLLKLATQFKRFDIAALEHIINSSKDKGKLLAIWRRGFEPEAKIADTISALNTLRKVVKSAKNVKNQTTINNILQQIDDDSKFLWKKVDQIEPQNKTKTLGYLASYIGKSWLIRKARWLIAAELWAATGRKKKEPTWQQAMMGAVPGASLALEPTSLFTPAALPRNFSKRALIKKGIFYTPIVGNIDVITGGLLGEIAADVILGKENEKQRKY